VTPRAAKKISQATRWSQGIMLVVEAIKMAARIITGDVRAGRWYAIYPNDDDIKGCGYGW
jgi:hypothetical protein